MRRSSRYHRAMASIEPGAAKVRLKQAFDLFEAGVSMKRAALRREHPDADEGDIARLLCAWLQTRPGARYGDGVGRPRTPETLG
jgi:hypothetical protein